MQQTQAHRPLPGCLRLVFNDTVMSFSLPDKVTFGEVARTLEQLSSERRGDTAAIDVTLRTSDELTSRRYLNPLAIHVTLGSRKRGRGSPRAPMCRR